MLEPAGHRIIVKPEEAEEKTESGLYKPQTEVSKEQRATTKGVVMAIGPTAWKAFRDGSESKPWCRKGDIVRFAQYSGVEIDEGGENLRVINDEDIWAVYRKNGKGK
jgi:chaperonin GroES